MSQLKRNANWIDEITPPIGQIIDQNSGYPIPDRNYQANIHHISVQQTPSFASINSVQLPPTPTNIQPPDTILLQGNNAGSAFAPRRTPAATDHPDNISVTSSISQVTINGKPFNGPVYDKNGRQLN